MTIGLCARFDFLEQGWVDFSFKSKVENRVDINKLGMGMDEDGWRF